MSAWLVVLAVGVGSYLLRVSMIALVGHRGSSTRFERASGFVAPSAFAALAAGGVIAACSGSVGSGAVAPLAAVAVAVVAVRRSGSPHVAIAVGMPTLWVMNALLAG
jgi:branched-subunit amino acid transport protein